MCGHMFHSGCIIQHYAGTTAAPFVAKTDTELLYRHRRRPQ